jgi:hypothetical protein
MRPFTILLILFTVLIQSCSFEKDYNPTAHLSVERQDEMMDKIIRYMAKPPEGISFEERFYKGYDDHYQDQKRIHRLDAYYIDGQTHYFMVSRVAPSLTEKRVAIGGKLMLDDNGNLSYYEEVFRTWKMHSDTLNTRSALLFDVMVNGKDLTQYYTSNTGDADYIEFPDERTYFDVEKRMWRSK